MAERAMKKGGEQVEIRSTGCGINREINGGEWGLLARRKEWEHGSTDISTLEKRPRGGKQLVGREVRHLLSTVILTLM